MDARFTPHKEVSRRLIRSVTLQTMIGHVFANPQQCVSEYGGIHVVVGKKRFGVEAS